MYTAPLAMVGPPKYRLLLVSAALNSTSPLELFMSSSALPSATATIPGEADVGPRTGPSVKRVVDAVLVRHADQSVDRAVDRCRERGWGVDEVAVRRLLRRWNLPRAHQRQVRGAQLDDGFREGFGRRATPRVARREVQSVG